MLQNLNRQAIVEKILMTFLEQKKGEDLLILTQP